MDRININGVHLEVHHIAANPATTHLAPLVFLHEGLGSVAMWRDWPAQLCQASGRAGWVYSRRGYGQSDAVPDVRGLGRLKPDYMHDEAWVVLPALLEALHVKAPVLVGHSDGGSIALLHASRFPVTACVVMAPHVMVEDISVTAIAQARDAFMQGDLRSRLARYHADVDCAFWQWNDIWMSDAFRSFDIRQHCHRITAPVLAIQGVDDPYGTLRQIEDIQTFTSQTGRSPPQNGHVLLHKLEHCGHSPHRDQTAATTQLMVDFLADKA